jgi:hypothetical protein
MQPLQYNCLKHTQDYISIVFATKLGITNSQQLVLDLERPCLYIDAKACVTTNGYLQ